MEGRLRDGSGVAWDCSAGWELLTVVLVRFLYHGASGALVKAKGIVVGGVRLQMWRGSLDLQGRTLRKKIEDYSPVLFFQPAILSCPGE